MTKRAALYARVSTDEQAQNHSIPNQLEQARNHCQNCGYIVADEYVDAGFSGTSPNRPDYNRLLEDCRHGKIDIIVVYKLDRFFRSNQHIHNAIAELNELGVQFASVTEAFDTNSPMGRAMLGMLSTFAELERDNFLEWSKHGTRKAVSAGHYSGGIVAYGYRHNPETKRLEIDEEEAPVIRRIFDLCVNERLSTAAIAASLNAEGVPTRYGRDGRGIRGKAVANKWRAARINNMLHNRAYCGEWTYGRRTKNRHAELTRGHCPAIVEVALVDAAAAQLRRNNTWAPRNSRQPYLLRGLVKCGACGHNYSGTYYTRRASGERVQQYRCNRDGNREAYLGESCGAPTVIARIVEDEVWRKIVEFAERPDLVRAILADQHLALGPDDSGERLARIDTRLNDLRRQESKLLTLYTDRDAPISRELLDEHTAVIKRDREECERERDALLNRSRAVIAQRERLDTVEGLLVRLRERLGGATVEEKRRLIELLVDAIVVHADPGGLVRVSITFIFDEARHVVFHCSSANMERDTLRSWSTSPELLSARMPVRVAVAPKR